MEEKDNSGSFFEFQKLCKSIDEENSYNNKTEIIQNFLKKFKYLFK